MSKRSSLEVSVELLQKAKYPINITKLMYTCNMSFISLKSKLEELQSRKLIFRVNGSFDERKVYQISEKGICFLKAYERMKELYDKNGDIASGCLKNELFCT